MHDIEFRNQFPEKEIKNHSLFPKTGNYCLVIDDSLFEVINNETFANLFIKVRQNQCLFSFFQNIFIAKSTSVHQRYFYNPKPLRSTK